MKTTNNWIKICSIGIVLLGGVVLFGMIWFYNAWELASIMVIFGTAFLVQQLIISTKEENVEID